MTVDQLTRAARAALADALQAQGPEWRNAADSVRAGTYANAWVRAGVEALAATARHPLTDDDET